MENNDDMFISPDDKLILKDIADYLKDRYGEERVVYCPSLLDPDTIGVFNIAPVNGPKLSIELFKTMGLATINGIVYYTANKEYDIRMGFLVNKPKAEHVRIVSEALDKLIAKHRAANSSDSDEKASGEVIDWLSSSAPAQDSDTRLSEDEIKSLFDDATVLRNMDPNVIPKFAVHTSQSLSGRKNEVRLYLIRADGNEGLFPCKVIPCDSGDRAEIVAEDYRNIVSRRMDAKAWRGLVLSAKRDRLTSLLKESDNLAKEIDSLKKELGSYASGC